MHGMRLGLVAWALGIGLAVGAGAVGVGFATAQESPGMTTAETEVAMTDYAEALLGGGDDEAYFAHDIVVTMMETGQAATGPTAAKQAIDALHHDMFDAQPEVTGGVIGEGVAALEADFVGTHTGEFAGIAPTGRAIDVPYSVYYALDAGKITELQIYSLVNGIVQQLQATES